MRGRALSYLKAEHEEWYADGSYGGAWRDEVDAALGEPAALGDGGVAVIFGRRAPRPRRRAAAAPACSHLRDRGFAETCVRTDCTFPTPAAAPTLAFFFGKGVASRAAELLRGAPPDEPCSCPSAWRVGAAEAAAGSRPHTRGGSRDVVCACEIAA